MERPELVEDGRLRLGNATRGGLVAREVRILESRWQRMRLAFARSLSTEAAWFLAPAHGVHSLGARHPLRVVLLDAQLTVVELVALAPWRTHPGGSPAAVLLHASNPAVVERGDRLEWLAGQPRLEGRADWLEEQPQGPDELS